MTAAPGRSCRSRARLLAVLAVGTAFVLPGTASAHRYPDPAIQTLDDGVVPALPAGVVVQVRRPSVVDELVVSNPTRTVLEVLAVGGEPFLRISAGGVQANLASPDWYTTGTPEGGPAIPRDVVRDKGKGTPRWFLVSRQSSWSEFDSRLHPQVVVPAAARAAGKDAVLGVWKVPLRYSDRAGNVTGHVLFTPVRGGFTVGLDRASEGLQASLLQGELPGIFLPPPTTTSAVSRTVRLPSGTSAMEVERPRTRSWSMTSRPVTTVVQAARSSSVSSCGRWLYALSNASCTSSSASCESPSRRSA